jgi:GNAT superfamily N-acetyltransferase
MIITKRAIDLTPEEEARCRELSFGEDGWMCDYLDDALLYENQASPRRHTQTILYYESDTIIGWCMLIPMAWRARYEAQFFVDPAHRRRGIGTELLNEANKWGRYKPVIDLDNENRDFFMSSSNMWATP